MNNLLLVLFKLVLGIIMIIILYGYSDIKSFFKEIVYFYILCFFLGGTLYYFKIENLMKYQYILLFIPFGILPANITISFLLAIVIAFSIAFFLSTIISYFPFVFFIPSSI